MSRQQSDSQRVLTLLNEVLSILKSTVDAPAVKPRAPAGIYPHQSKYNPWRAYVWDSRLRKSVYLGAFPSVLKAKAAQKSYRAGKCIAEGTKAPVVRIVKGA